MKNKSQGFGLAEWGHVATIIIAVLALTISVWTLKENRDFNRLSFKPFLVLTSYITNLERSDGIYVTNNGTGPAIIKKFELFVRDKKVRTENLNVFAEDLAKYGNIGDIQIIISNISNGSVLRKDASQYIFVLANKSTNLTMEHMERFSNLIRDTRVTIEYDSFYGESFKKSQDDFSVPIVLP